jgi:two-component SAPR family response regulator
VVDSAALAGLRVLVVEDEMLVSLLIEDILNDASCIIIGPFDRVSRALAAARTERIDLAVLDVNVDGVKVYPVAEVLDARQIPFVFLSGYGQQAVPADRPDWRMCAKPFRPQDLTEMLARQVKGE